VAAAHARAAGRAAGGVTGSDGDWCNRSGQCVAEIYWSTDDCAGHHTGGPAVVQRRRRLLLQELVDCLPVSTPATLVLYHSLLIVKYDIFNLLLSF